jgi:hypothetical protein
MSSTFSAPIRVNTRQTTSNDGTLSPDNTGAAVLTQQVVIDPAHPDVVFYLPAGSIIHGVQAYVTTAGTSRGIVVVNDAGTSVLGSVSTADVGVINAVFDSNAAVAANVGPTAVAVYMNAGNDTSAGTLSITYTARNANGTITPYGSGLVNQ